MSETHREFMITYDEPDITPAEFIEEIRRLGAKKLIFELLSYFDNNNKNNERRCYRGYVYFADPKYLKHVERGQKFYAEVPEDLFDVEEYIAKEETKETGPWGYGYKTFKVYSAEQEKTKTTTTANNKNITIKDWQDALLEKFVQTPSERTIYWYYSRNNVEMMRWFVKYLVVNHAALFVSGKTYATDVKRAIAWFQKNKKPIPSIIIFYFSRTTMMNKRHVCYDIIENIKDGMVFVGKYKSGMITFDSPHVLCFADFKPPSDGDRWAVTDLDSIDAD